MTILVVRHGETDGNASQLTSLSKLVEVETFRVILRQQWERCGRKMTPVLADLASTLIVVASRY